jgi:transposase-like protein
VKRWKRAVRRALPSGVKLGERRGHLRFVCEGCQRVITTCSGSPKNMGHALQAVKRDVVRYVEPHVAECEDNMNGERT